MRIAALVTISTDTLHIKSTELGLREGAPVSRVAGIITPKVLAHNRGPPLRKISTVSGASGRIDNVCMFLAEHPLAVGNITYRA